MKDEIPRLAVPKTGNTGTGTRLRSELKPLLVCDFIKQVIKERHWWRELAIEVSKNRDYETAFKATITADAMDKIIELYNKTKES